MGQCSMGSLEACSSLDQEKFGSHSISPMQPTTRCHADLTVTPEHCSSGDPVDSKRLVGSNIDVLELPEGEGPPFMARFRTCSCPSSTLQFAPGHVTAVCTTPFGPISEAT